MKNVFYLKTQNFQPKYCYDTYKAIYFRKGYEKIHKIISFYQFSSNNKRVGFFFTQMAQSVLSVFPIHLSLPSFQIQ